MHKKTCPAFQREVTQFLGDDEVFVDNTTNTCNPNFAGSREYPRAASVYTIRTPSPKGQHGTPPPLLPTFLSRAVPAARHLTTLLSNTLLPLHRALTCAQATGREQYISVEKGPLCSRKS